MSLKSMNSLVGITDYDEATNLSTYLIGHGWNADHASSPEQLLADLEEGNYNLVVMDEGILSDSEWSLEEYLQEIGPDVSVVVLTQPGESWEDDLTGDDGLVVLQHPYSCWELKSAIARVTQMTACSEDSEEEETQGEGTEEEDSFLCDELESAVF
jgi:DNA-binding NtrC family response regulator